MKFWNVILVVFVFAFVFNSAEIRAQALKSPQKISINDKSMPFKEGRTVIEEVEVTGLDNDFENYGGAAGEAVYKSDFLRVLRENRAAYAEDYFYFERVEKITSLLKEYLARKGYLKPEVTAFGKTLPKNRMRLIFSVERGARSSVSEIRFVGNKNIPGEELVANLKQCLGDDWEVFEQWRYQYYIQKCSSVAASSRGYFLAKIGMMPLQRFDNNYVVTIHVEEGARFLLGEIKVKGAKIFSESEILEMLGQKTGDVADGKRLREFVFEKLKKAYGDKGYPLYEAELEPVYFVPQEEGLDGIANITINVEEGQQFKISGIRFYGVDIDTEDRLLEILDFQKGEVYNESKIADGIRKINELKEFSEINRDADVDIKTGVELNEVFLRITTRKIKQ
jgi:outer membrane protein insertion porin family